MSENCNCQGLDPGVLAEKPFHIPGRRKCECGWDFQQVSEIITDIDWETNPDNLVYEINYTENDLMQCTNPKCRIIKVF